jgi:hypothetical protein
MHQMWYPLALEEPTPHAFQPPTQFCLVQFEFEPIHSSTRVYTLCIRAPILVPRTICAHKFEHLNLHFVHREHSLDAFESTPSLHSSKTLAAFEHTPSCIRSLTLVHSYNLTALEHTQSCSRAHTNVHSNLPLVHRAYTLDAFESTPSLHSTHTLVH